MVRYKKIIYILFFILLSFNTNAKSPPPGTGTSDIPANILIMLDNSGSMSARLAGAVQIHYPVDVNVDRSLYYLKITIIFYFFIINVFKFFPEIVY